MCVDPSAIPQEHMMLFTSPPSVISVMSETTNYARCVSYRNNTDRTIDWNQRWEELCRALPRNSVTSTGRSHWLDSCISLATACGVACRCQSRLRGTTPVPWLAGESASQSCAWGSGPGRRCLIYFGRTIAGGNAWSVQLMFHTHSMQYNGPVFYIGHARPS